MSSSPHEDERDYTDGASAQEIQSAIREVPRGRGDQQIAGSYQPRRSMSSFRDADDAGGAVFDGPGSVTIPSSVTGLRSTRSRSFRAGSHRGSRVFDQNRQSSELDYVRPVLSRRGTGMSDATDALIDSDGETSSHVSERPARSRYRRQSTINAEAGEEATRERQTSMFGNLASFFGAGRQTSPSRKSDASRSRRGSVADYAESISEEREDRWGYHSSEEGSSEGDNVSLPGSLYPASSRGGGHSSPPSPTSAFPGMGRDPIFGDTRLDIDDVSLAETIPITSGPPSQQDVYIADEDIKLRLLGYQTIRWRSLLWNFLSVASLGTLGLIGHWFPELWLRCVARKTSFIARSANIIIVEVPPSSLNHKPMPDPSFSEPLERYYHMSNHDYSLSLFLYEYISN
jgi:cation-transporting P-type ATPase 13A2